MLINLKLATQLVQCGGRHWRNGIQTNFSQAVRNKMTQSCMKTENSILNRPLRLVSKLFSFNFNYFRHKIVETLMNIDFFCI